MDSHFKKRRKGWRVKAAGICLSVTALTFGMAGPASAYGSDDAVTDWGPSVNIYGQTVGIPFGVATVEVHGDNQYVTYIEVVYTGQAASNLRFEWEAFDRAGKHMGGSVSSLADSGGEGQIRAGERFEVNAELPDTGTLVGRVYILDALAAEPKVKIYNGINWSFWN